MNGQIFDGKTENIKSLFRCDLSHLEKILKNLSQEKFKNLLRQFLEFFCRKTFYEIYQPKFLALDYLTYPELHEESVVFLTEHRLLQKIIKISSSEDLALFDYIKIDSERVKKIVLDILKFGKFREKEILILKKYSKIYSKIFSISFEIGLSLKFLKKKTFYLQVNFKKFLIIAKYFNIQEQILFLFFYFWNFYFYNKIKSKPKKEEELQIQKIIEEREKKYTSIKRFFTLDIVSYWMLEKKIFFSKKPKFNYFRISKILVKYFEKLIFDCCRKRNIQILLEKNFIFFLSLNNVLYFKNKFQEFIKIKIFMNQKNKKFSIMNKTKLFEKFLKRNKIVFYDKKKIFSRKKFSNNMDGPMKNKNLFINVCYEEKTMPNYYRNCVFLAFLNQF